MSEQEYIDVSDLTRIRTIKECLRQIISENSAGAIPASEYKTVYSLLSEWEVELNARLERGK